MITKLNRDGSIMRDSDKQQLKDKIAAARKEFTTLTQNYEQQAMQAQQQLMQKTAEQVNNIAEKIAKQKGLSMVIVSQAVVYPGNAQDITSQVISKMK
jgi:outer membrane protein